MAGTYDETDMRLTPNFTLSELTVTNTGLSNVPTQAEIAHLRALAVHVLQPLRERLGRPVLVNSAFRSAQVNRAVGGRATSQHRLGQAADIRVVGMTSRALAQHIIDMRLPFDQLIEEFGRWVHVSYRPSNRGQVLTAVTRAGRTVYEPGLVA